MLDALTVGSRQPPNASRAHIQTRDAYLRSISSAGSDHMNTRRAVAPVTLRTLPMFADTPERVLQALACISILQPVERNFEVVRGGERTDFVYLIVSGRLNVSMTDKGGREAILSVLGPGELFGEMSMLDDGACSATVKTVAPTVLVVIASAVFMQCLQENFDVAHYVMRKLIQRLRVANRKIESLALLDVSGRVARLLLEMAEPVSGKQVVTCKTSRRDLAKMIGASREMVSRVVKDLELRGLIEQTDGRITFCDITSRSESGQY